MDELNLQPGERVRITIEANVRSVDGTYLRLKCPVGNATLIFRPSDYAAIVERVAPAEWPPEPADLWRHDDGTLWFGTLRGSGTVLVDQYDDDLNPHGAYGNPHEFTLVHREQQDGGVDRG